MTQAKITVGVPVRNGGDFLPFAIDSIIHQTAENLEIIVSDNGSTDGTAEYLQELQERDPRVKVFRQEAGLTAYDNFHFVLSKATGDYFMWAAHDDTRDLDFIEKLVGALEANPQAVLAFGDVKIVTPDDKSGKIYPFPFSTAGLGRLRRMKKVSQLQCFNIYGVWRTVAIKKVPYSYCSWWPDLPMMMSAAIFGEFIHVPGVSFHYFEVPKTSLDRVKYQDFQVRFNLPKAVFDLIVASYRACRQVGGLALGMLGGGLVLWKQLVNLPGFVFRRIRALFAYCLPRRAS